MLTCPKCKKLKKRNAFFNRNDNSTGKQSYCKDCQLECAEKRGPQKRPARPNQDRVSGLKRNYNITVNQYNKMLNEQGGVCAICGSPPSTKRLAVDHSRHCCSGIKSCGKCIRGLLCMTCNTGLGKFKDSPELLTIAIKYLTKT